MLASGSQLAQIRPSGTSAVNAFTAENLVAEITLIAICNTTGTAADASIFHDDDGSTFSQATALIYEQSIPANETVWIRAGSEGSGITVKPDGEIGVQAGTANALTFTFYGVTEQVAQ